MIRFVNGNLLDAPTEALVNTVNTDGVMGKGIALQFKEAYPTNFKHYQKVCKAGALKPGDVLPFKERNLQGERIIINFATKARWIHKSSYAWIESGLKQLVELIHTWNIRSIAIPPLGCGNGGLDWAKVKPMIEQYLGPLKEVDVIVYEPSDAVKAVLQEQQVKKEAKLTPARAMLLFAMYHYETLGEAPNLFVANKLAWLLQRMGEPLKLEFTKHLYGPYANKVEHVLYHLNGKYLSGLEQKQARPFESLTLKYDTFKEVENFVKNELSAEQYSRLERLIHLVDGFQSSWSLEVLASVDYLLKENPSLTQEELLLAMQNWNPRKKRLVEPRHVEIAYQRLKEYQEGLQ